MEQETAWNRVIGDDETLIEAVRECDCVCKVFQRHTRIYTLMYIITMYMYVPSVIVISGICSVITYMYVMLQYYSAVSFVLTPISWII